MRNNLPIVSNPHRHSQPTKYFQNRLGGRRKLYLLWNRWQCDDCCWREYCGCWTAADSGFGDVQRFLIDLLGGKRGELTKRSW